jgi:hypothetical protein
MQDAQNIPIVISGPPRSGTTLLYNLFDGHPDVLWLVTEGFFFEHVVDLAEQFDGACKALADLDVDQLIEGVWDRQLMPPPFQPPAANDLPQVAWDAAAFRRHLAGRRPGEARGLWTALLQAELAALGWRPRRFVCLKAPDYGKTCVGANRLFPEARCIAIVRDPYRALDSLKGSREKRGVKRLTWPTLARCVAEMNWMADRVRSLPPDRVRWLRYEDLVADPEGKMRRLAEWLGLDFDPCLTRPSNLGVAWSGNSTFGDGFSGVARREDSGLRMLSEAEVAFIRKTAAPFAENFGYDLSRSPVLAEQLS